MKNLLFFALLLFINLPVLSHGGKSNCSDECNDYYCPVENKDKKLNNDSKK